mmetsp:Transcript_51488/g.137171  ORF Transcript_51488/g.137171 Transcript_51488/m.137171 type:complete len:596 (-) Transcript_51488:47-1834(-)
MRGAVVLPDDHVLDRFPRPSHLHAVREVRPTEHWVLLLCLRVQRLVRLDPNDAVDVSRLRRAAGRVHQEDGVLHVALGAHQQLEVCAVDRVPVLEGHDGLALGEHGAHLGGRLHGVRERNGLDAVQVAADVVATHVLHQSVHRGVLDAGGAVALLGLHRLVWRVDGGGLEHSDVVALVLQQELVALLEARRVVHVEGDGQAEELLLGKAHVLHHGLVRRLVHEALEGAEGAVHQAEYVARLPLVQLNGCGALRHQRLGLGRVLHHQVHERPAVGGARRGGARVDAALRLRLPHEAPRALALVRLHGHGGVDVAEGFEHVRDGGRRVALDLLVRAPPERLAQRHLLPREVWQVPLRGLDRRLGTVSVAVALVDRDALGICVGGDVAPRPVGHWVQRALAVFPDVQRDTLGRLVHAPTRDEDGLVTLCQGSLERLDLADEVEVRCFHLLTVPILRVEFLAGGDPFDGLPQRLLLVLRLHLLGTRAGRVEQVHRVDGYQVHARENLGKVLVHQRYEHVVGRKPGGGKAHALAVRGQVLLDMRLEGRHLVVEGGRREQPPHPHALRSGPRPLLQRWARGGAERDHGSREAAEGGARGRA